MTTSPDQGLPRQHRALSIECLRDSRDARQATDWIYQEWAQFESEDVWRQNCQDVYQSLEGDCAIPKFFVARLAGELVGMASLVADDLPGRADLTPWLANVYVVPQWRGCGIGRKLIERVMEWASEVAPVIYLYTDSKAALYQRLGWETMQECIYAQHKITLMRYQTKGQMD